jgi:hypothetical protein
MVESYYFVFRKFIANVEVEVAAYYQCMICRAVIPGGKGCAPNQRYTLQCMAYIMSRMVVE